MDRLLHALFANEARLQSGFNRAAWISLHKAINRSTPSKPQEPDVVAMLVLEGVSYIAKTLQKTVGAFGIRSTISSVFCHQKPTVEFNNRRDRCELGDILIVHRHTDARHPRTPHSNALLLQAKMVSGHMKSIPQSEQHQLRLYESWPRFRYVRSGPSLKGQLRDVKPKVRHSGAQYLLIDDDVFGPTTGGAGGFPGVSCMAVWPAVPVLYAYRSLGDELVRLMAGMSGRSFIDTPGGDPSGWSTVIWDLLLHSARFLFTRNNVGVSQTSRLGGQPMTSSAGSNFRLIGDNIDINAPASQQRDYIASRILGRRAGGVPPNFREPSNENMDDMGGVSVILIETSGPDE